LKVILNEDIPNLGEKGEIKDVAPGYARNFLIPKKLAVEVTAGRLKDIQLKEELNAKKYAREVELAEELGEKIRGKTISIKVKAGEGGRLFGSVTSSDIADALKTEGINVDKKKIELKDPIKMLGTFEVQVKLHPQVSVPVAVVVESM